jgi:hypothetical protein
MAAERGLLHPAPLISDKGVATLREDLHRLVSAPPSRTVPSVCGARCE